MSSKIISQYKTYVANNYTSLPVIFERGEGAILFDANNNAYIDMMSAYSATSFGHRNKKIIAPLVKQLDKLTVVSRAYLTESLGDFCEKLSKISDVSLAKNKQPAKVLPCNGGAEAVEAALKLARKYSYDINPKAEAVIIFATNNFHGRTITITAGSTESSYKTGFGPFPTGIEVVEYGNAKALAEKIKQINKSNKQRAAAFIVEPIQGEAGIKLPPKGYLKQVAKICKSENVLFLADEIQTGLGRTGKLWATQHDGVQPDIRIIGKALGGGIIAVSAIVARPDIMDAIKPGTHGSTFGGNPVAAVVASAALDILMLNNQKIVTEVAQKGEYFMKRLSEMRNRLNTEKLGHYITDIRGQGLFIGMEIGHNNKKQNSLQTDPAHPKAKTTARTICEIMLSHGIVSKETHETVLRLAPPFVISKAQLDKTITVIEASIRQHAKLVATNKKFDIENALKKQNRAKI